jgi:hypothetical protein
MPHFLSTPKCPAKLGGALLLLACSAFAQSPIDQRLLGMSEQDLLSSMPDARRLAKPILGPRGSRGIFVIDLFDGSDANTEVTLFFRKKQLDRIEKRRRAPFAQCQGAFTSLVASLAAQYGTADGANQAADENGSAAWVQDSFKVMAYRLLGANRCDLLVSIEPHAARDASDL